MFDTNEKLIIVEGQDNCGKSTLLRKLRSMIDTPRIITLSSSGPPKNTGQEWNIEHYSEVFELMLEMVLGSSRFTVLADRFHIGETCYGPLFRNADSEYIWELEEQVMKLIGEKTYLIVLTDNGDDIISREDGHSIEQSAEEFDKIGDMFVAGYERSSIPNKKLITISDDGWPDAQKIYNWIYGSYISEHKFIGE